MSLCVLTIGILGALVFSVPAFGWYQYYVNHKYEYSGGSDYSDNNSGLSYNEVSYTDNGGTLYGLTLCDTGGSCYTYDYVSGGFGDDFRNISYGHAKCHDPNETIWVNYCYVQNGS
jgi:hypothetical protein